jgi:hypothetical protein
MYKIKRTDRLTNDVFQRAKEERLILKKLKNGRHLWIGHIIGHNEFAVNILEVAISGKKAMGKPRLQYVKQVARNTAADSYTAMKRMACNKSRRKAANQSKYWRIRRRRIRHSTGAVHKSWEPGLLGDWIFTVAPTVLWAPGKKFASRHRYDG